MLHKLSLQTPPHAWERPTYKHGNRVSKETFMMSTATAFRTRITDEFRLTLISDSRRERFPLVDELAVHIEIHSTRRYKLPFVVKNVLDALKGHAYNDDGLINSICAEQHSRYDCEKVFIALYANKRIMALQDIQGYKPFISFNVDAVPSDVVLPLRASPEHIIEPSITNQLTITSIEKELLVGYDGPIYATVGEVSMVLYSMLNKGDIDNLTLPFLMAMNGIVYQDMSCMDRILLNINRHCDRDCTDIRIIGTVDDNTKATHAYGVLTDR